MIYRICRNLIRFFFVVFCRWKVEGAENIPEQGPVLVAANHFSYWDPVVLACALDRKIHFMAKSNIFEIPVLGLLVPYFGAFPVNRTKRADRKSLRTAVNLLDEGKVVGIFPEGTRSGTGSLLPALPGAAFLICKAGVPVCPVALVRKKRIFGNNLFPCYHVLIGESFSMEEKTGRRNYQEEADKIMVKIKGLMGLIESSK
ncbi:MAG: lysophospholipid acyltransferase family protein [Syntrophaceticus sp.]|jgi:1-acyl-sn-glycerol-3-phosphate acyltransferase|nr:lysophospholipid acyltransferase family protein [Syntrophaceticus sp.]MDD3314415.1 lysophospholipid acyltransferase family protein [Syntrophaceticus sp.]MDD4359660.1 lysophospholipid acyltransferase family protein [Syntrophaceticus sp.]MDD4782923.1 lysophospholipid acyltransferase family protein [Syntrophaceticus sp.]HBG22025.1 1-acyl-sn-glycerol-3-phosphate acyltransferase [Peptococcaceae bacterium]